MSSEARFWACTNKLMSKSDWRAHRKQDALAGIRMGHHRKGVSAGHRGLEKRAGE